MYLLGSTKIQALNLGMLHGLDPPSSKQVQQNVWFATTSMAATISVLMLLKNIGWQPRVFKALSKIEQACSKSSVWLQMVPNLRIGNLIIPN